MGKPAERGKDRHVMGSHGKDLTCVHMRLKVEMCLPD